jgi:heat shock protein HtpX
MGFSVNVMTLGGIAVAIGADGISSVTVGLIIAAVYGTVSYYASMRVALYTAGATQIQKSDAPELWRIVENLSIANGQPMPAVYLVNDASHSSLCR